MKIKKDNIQVVDASGSNYDIGFSVGSQTKDKIKKYIIKSPNGKELNERLTLLKKTYPQFYEEIKGMADASKVSEKKLLAYNLDIVKSCTTIVAKQKNGLLIGHNEDLSNNDILLLKINHGKFKSLSVTYYGLLPGLSASINSYGFIQTMNALKPTDERVGLSTIILNRKTLESKTINEAKNVILNNNRSTGGNYIFYKDQNYLNLETTATKYAILKTEEKFVHTNSYLSKKLLGFENRPANSLQSSVSRLNVANELLKDKKITIELVKEILSSHKNKPFCICRHQKTRTAGTIIMNSAKKEMRIAYGNPCKSEFERFKI